MLWNISGLRAVELTLTNGKKFRISTDEPDTLVRAIQMNKIVGTNESAKMQQLP